MSKKIVKVKLEPQMDLQTALLEFPEVAMKINEFNAIKPNPRDFSTMHKYMIIDGQLCLLEKLTEKDLDAELSVLKRFEESLNKFYENLRRRLDQQGPRPPKTNINYGGWNQERGRLQILASIWHSDSEKLLEQWDRLNRKDGAWVRVLEELVRIKEVFNKELKEHVKWLRE